LQGSLRTPAAQKLRALTVAIIAVTLLVMIWLGVEYANFAWEQESPVLGWSLGKVYLALPVGSLLMLLHLVAVAPRWVSRAEWERIEGFDPQAL
jgi:TRAP-type transport system small permease protein